MIENKNLCEEYVDSILEGKETSGKIFFTDQVVLKVTNDIDPYSPDFIETADKTIIGIEYEVSQDEKYVVIFAKPNKVEEFLKKLKIAVKGTRK